MESSFPHDRQRTRRVRVRIDLGAVRDNLSREDERPVTDAEARQFLIDAGFQPEGEDGVAWVVDEAEVGHLHPSEVTSVEVLDEWTPGSELPKS